MSERHTAAFKDNGRESFGRHHRQSARGADAVRAPTARALPRHALQPKIENRDIVLRWFILGDGVAFAIGFLCALALAAAVNLLCFGRGLDQLLSHDAASRFAIYAVLAAVILLRFELTGHYRMRLPFWVEAQKIVEALGIGLIIDGFLQFAMKQDFSRLWLASSWIFAAIAMIALRGLARKILRRRGSWNLGVLLIGCGAVAEETKEALVAEAGLGYEVTAQIGDPVRALEGAGGSWRQLCAMRGADYVLVALDGHALSEAESALAQLMQENLPFSVAPPFRSLLASGTEPLPFFSRDVMLWAQSDRLAQPLPRLIKRGFDVLAAGAGLIVLTPLLVVLALRVRSDGGPALFRQLRLGMNGKPFACLKFRSMSVDAGAALVRYLAAHPEARAEWQRSGKLRDDPRVTRFGKFLRRWSLDELPQLLNVVRGEMSLVGPRPIVVAEVARYEHDIAHYYRVRPGMTGVWQVSGRSDVS